MPANINPTLNEADKAKSAAGSAVEHAERSFTEATAAAKTSLAEAAKRVERTVSEGLDTLRAQSRSYTDGASQHFDDAQRYVSERVKERPITATLAGLGVGVLLGLLLASSRNHQK